MIFLINRSVTQVSGLDFISVRSTHHLYTEKNSKLAYKFDQFYPKVLKIRI